MLCGRESLENLTFSSMKTTFTYTEYMNKYHANNYQFCQSNAPSGRWRTNSLWTKEWCRDIYLTEVSYYNPPLGMPPELTEYAIRRIENIKNTLVDPSRSHQATCPELRTTQECMLNKLTPLLQRASRCRRNNVKSKRKLSKCDRPT
jgi:hypothetical protein